MFPAFAHSLSSISSKQVLYISFILLVSAVIIPNSQSLKEWNEKKQV